MDFRSLVPSGWRNLPGRREEDDPFLSLHREINRLFDDMWRGVGAAPPGAAPAGAIGGTLTPRLDLKETDQEIRIEAELPGVDEKDVEVSLKDNILTIKGEKKGAREEKGEGYHLTERSYGSFLRQVPLPGEVDPDKVAAAFAKGVLTVTLPKPPQAESKVKKIEIKKSA